MPLEKPQNDVDRIPSYAAGTRERAELERALEALESRTEEVPLIINGRAVETGRIHEVRCPHDHQRVLARAHLASEREVQLGIEAALQAQETWAAMDGYQRAAVFLKAADLLAGPRRTEHIAAIMANQSKTPFEAEIDLAELVDFWRFNAYYMKSLYAQQPDQGPGESNRFDWRPLEGFILAVSPFNFYSIAGNLPTAPALAGNVALWKPSRSVILANYRIMQVLMEAGLPPGVINFLPCDGRAAEVALTHPQLAGLHFTGSYETLVSLWETAGRHLRQYRNFPRVVGETGGKDFIFVHPSADLEAVAAGVLRGAFEYQGQKCSAASRLYVPATLWDALEGRLCEELPRIKVGPVEDLSTFMGALIDEEAFQRVVSYIQHAREHPETYRIVHGGDHDGSQGWFVSPTVIVSGDPAGRLMTEEVFGPVLTAYIYPDGEYEETLRLCNHTSPYGLTGAIFAQDREAIVRAERALRFAAGNFYINDKPSGAVVGRQPFGGARHSGTNDKAGSWVNLARWMSPRTIKENLNPPHTWPRPYMQ